MDLGHWIFDQEFDENEWFGFVYRIIELDTLKEYIGKKQFFKIQKKQVKGRKNKKTVKIPSNWRFYTGSSTDLNEQIKLKGLSNYRFEIISLHKTRGSLHYAEVSTQIFEDVLRKKLSTGVKKFYNKAINGVKFIPPEEVAEETKMKIKNSLLELYSDKTNHWWYKLSEFDREQHIIKFLKGNNQPTKRSKTDEEYDMWLTQHTRGENNPMFGKPSNKKNKKYEEMYGCEKANQLKEHLKAKNIGKKGTFTGKIHSKDTIKKISDSNKGKHSGSNNPMFNTPCYYKMTEEEKQQWKNNISKSTKGKSLSADHKQKIGAAHKGKQKPEYKCPHCNKIGRGGNMIRYHFDNCKFKPL